VASGGQAAAPPPSSVMKSRRRMPIIGFLHPPWRCRWDNIQPTTAGSRLKSLGRSSELTKTKSGSDRRSRIWLEVAPGRLSGDLERTGTILPQRLKIVLYGTITAASGAAEDTPRGHLFATGARLELLGGSSDPLEQRIRIHGRCGCRGAADIVMGLALKDDPGAFPRVLFQPKFFRLLAHLVLVPAQHVRRGRDSVAEGEGSLEIIEVHFGPGLT
jgi:hypothetical protein